MLTQRKPLLSSSSYWVTLRPSTAKLPGVRQADEECAAACRQGVPPVEDAKLGAQAERSPRAAPRARAARVPRRRLTNTDHCHHDPDAA